MVIKDDGDNSGFNPRARTGRDFMVIKDDGDNSGFNPRARTGRDDAPVRLSQGELQFQSTRPHGARPEYKGVLAGWNAFQSTRPHGARRPPELHPHRRAPCFNPRARTGRDDDRREELRRALVSIHAPARGATWTRASCRYAL